MRYSSSVIHDIARHCAGIPSAGYAYFFFDSRDSQTALQKHENLIRSLISQLSHQAGGIPLPLNDLYRVCRDGDQQPSTEDLQNTLESVLEGFGDVFIMIDSLDECAERRKLTSWIAATCARATGNVHLLVSSRPEHEIMTALLPICTDNLSVHEVVDRDIEIYLDLLLETDPDFSRWPPETRAEIKEKLMKGSHGMYVHFESYISFNFCL